MLVGGAVTVVAPGGLCSNRHGELARRPAPPRRPGSGERCGGWKVLTRVKVKKMAGRGWASRHVKRGIWGSLDRVTSKGPFS